MYSRGWRNLRSCPQAKGLLPATDPLSPCSQHAQKIKIKITSAQMSKIYKKDTE